MIATRGLVMRFIGFRAFLACLVLSNAAVAGPIEDIFPTITSCYLRDYSDSHLTNRPDQMVKRIAVGPDLYGWYEGSPAPAIRISLLLRDGVSVSSVATCWPTGANLGCVIEEGFGNFTVSSTAEGVNLQVEEAGMTFETFSEESPDAVNAVTVSGTSGDDRSFAIPATRSSGCP
jgi:hypothetical protein